MNVKFQELIVAYFFKYKSNLLSKYKSEWLSTDDLRLALKLIKKYYSKYRRPPSLVIFEDFISDIENNESIIQYIRKIYSLEFDQEPVESKIVLEIQRAAYKQIMDKHYDDLTKADDKFLGEILKKFADINELSKLKEIRKSVDGLLSVVKIQKKEIFPSFLEGWNKMMTKGGFCTPELILIMSSAKGFKTGFCINTALNLIIGGAKCLYVDWENGEDDILMRFQQCLAQITYSEHISGEYDAVMMRQMKTVKNLGGGLRVLSLNAYADSLDLVDDELTRLANEEGFIPQFIVYDYLDLADCADKSIKEPRNKIQHIFHHSITINKKRNTFALCPAQVNRKAVGAKTFTIADFAEDYGKAMNAHSAVAICRTKEEIENNLARLCAVMHRQGLGPGAEGSIINIHIDEKTMIVAGVEEEDFNLDDI